MKWVEDKFNKMWRELQEKGINHSGPELRKFLGVTDKSTIDDAPRFEAIYEKALGSRQYGDASQAEQNAFRQLMTQSVRKKVGYQKNRDNSFSLIEKPRITAEPSQGESIADEEIREAIFPPEAIRFLSSFLASEEVSFEQVGSAPISLQPSLFPVEAAIRAGVAGTIAATVGGCLPVSLQTVAEQTRILERYGLSSHVAAATVGLLLSHAAISLSYRRVGEAVLRSDSSASGVLKSGPIVEAYGELVVRAFDCMLCGLCVGIEEGTASWLLSLASMTGLEEARSLKASLSLAAKGNPHAIRLLVSRGYEKWTTFVRPYWKNDTAFHAENLGLTYQLMCRLENDPTIQFRLGVLLWEFGHSGDEGRAKTLIAQAALSGSRGAWLTIQRYWSEGEMSLVNALLEEGVFTAEIDDANPTDSVRD